jgi:DNA-binding XRE family transcriptional regulator
MIGGKRTGPGRKSRTKKQFIGDFEGWKDDLVKFSGEKLKDLRLKEGLTQKEVAEFLGLAQISITGFENGRTALSAQNIYLLSCLFGVKPSKFFPPTKKVTII